MRHLLLCVCVCVSESVSVRLSWGQIQQVNQESCGSPRCATIFVLCQESRVTVTHRSHLGGCAWVLFFYLAFFFSLSLSSLSLLHPSLLFPRPAGLPFTT